MNAHFDGGREQWQFANSAPSCFLALTWVFVARCSEVAPPVDIPTAETPQGEALSKSVLDRLLADKKADLSDIQVVWDNGKILPERNGQIFGCPAAGGKNYLGTPGVQSVVNSVQVQK